MSKVLIVTSVASMVDQFLMPSIRLLKEMDYEVHLACNFLSGNTCDDKRIHVLKQILQDNNIAYYQIEFARDVTKITQNILAYRQVKKLLKLNKYEIIHCHSPIGGIVARAACRRVSKNSTKIIYTAHGFHFYKGAPLKNWFIYYPIERIFAHYTDCLTTINVEDYTRAKRFRLKKNGHVEYVPGVGIDTKKFKRYEKVRTEMRNELGIGENETVLLSVGELNQNKNHKIVIEALAKLGRKDLRYIICGRGLLLDSHLQLAKSLGIEDQVTFAGYRADVDRFYQAADIFVISSFREGLPVAPMEAMAAGLPCIASKIRGNIDLFSESELLFDPANTDSLISAINKATDKSIAKQETEKNAQTLVRFSTEEVMKAMKEIYLGIM